MLALDIPAGDLLADGCTSVMFSNALRLVTAHLN